MSNMLQSSQTQATQAPSFYTNYLSNVASQASNLLPGQPCAPQFAGAQPLQTKAFESACKSAGTYQPSIAAGQGYIGQAAGQNITGAAQPFLAAGTKTSPLCVLAPYAREATCFTGYEAGMPLVAQGAGTSGLAAASPFLGRAAGAGGACASAGYVNQATRLSAPCAAAGYLQQAAGASPADLASQYMNPYIQTAVQSLSDIGQRNIRQNLSPQATAAAVGSGQYGSQRGAQVLGQIQAQAEQDLNNQIAQMLSGGYGQALTAAGQRQALLGQLGQTAGGLTSQQMQNLINAGNVQGTLTQQQQNLLGTLGSTAGTLTNQQAQNLINAGLGLGSQQTSANQIAANLGQTASGAQQAFNTAQLQAAQTAAQAASQQANALQQAGLGMGTLGTQGQNINLACINALATLGGQQQTIAQNKQNFPLSTLSSLSSLLQGYSIPTTTATTLCMSPLSAAAAIGSGTLGLLTPTKAGCASTIPINQVFNTVKGWFNSNSSPNTTSPIVTCYYDCKGNLTYCQGFKSGGLVKAKSGGSIGCKSTRSRGGLPK